MMISEFIDRTGVRPTAEEYARIEEEYYEFNGNKDEFCRAWVRCHPASVRKAKERKAYQAELSKIFTIVIRLDKYKGTHGGHKTPARNVLKEREIELMKKHGINVGKYTYDDIYSVNDLQFELTRFIERNTSERV